MDVSKNASYSPLCLQAFSHTNSSVLDGGLPRWIDEGYPVETGSSNSTQDKSGTEKGTSYPVPSMNEAVIRCMRFILDFDGIRTAAHDPKIIIHSVQGNGVQLDFVTE